MTFARASRSVVGLAAVAFAAGCVHPTQFEQYMSNQQWEQAAKEFATDSSLQMNDRTLYRGAMLFGTPGRPTYDPPRALSILSLLIARFPSTQYRDEAEARAALLRDVIRAREDRSQLQRDLERRIDALTREVQSLRARADSLTGQDDSLRAMVARLESDRKERDDQLAKLRLELQQLKEIDLKPRKPIKP